MNQGIISYLAELPDGRRRAGQRHDQTFVLLLVLMSTMSGYHGYRAIGDFITRNEVDLLASLKPKKNRLPSFYTVRRVIQDLDFDKLSKSFYKWVRQHTDITEQEWLHVDGKAMKGTMSDYSIEKQRFINLVSIYSSRKKLVIGNALVDNSKESEIPVVQKLIADLGLSGTTLTLDALHCQKKL
jgi:hypothetical protein|nr:ISAs1 family transposase [Mucilaginibacter gracilis]